MRGDCTKLVLVVEDDRDVAELDAYLFESMGYEVVIAPSVFSAWRLIEAPASIRSRFCLVLLDVLLPDGNGIELLRWIRFSDRAIPIVVYTASPRFRAEALASGADGFVVKPDVLLLQTTIRSILANTVKNSA